MTKDEAMKLALEALKQIDEAMPFPVAKLAQAVLREALAEQPAQQEPVAWVWTNSKGWLTYGEQAHDYFDSKPLYTSPPTLSLAQERSSDEQPAQQESVGYVAENGVVDWNGCAPPILTDLYTSPQRTWVGLTDEEFQWIYDHGRTPAGMMELVEAKLKEKNT